MSTTRLRIAALALLSCGDGNTMKRQGCLHLGLQCGVLVALYLRQDLGRHKNAHTSIANQPASRTQRAIAAKVLPSMGSAQGPAPGVEKKRRVLAPNEDLRPSVLCSCVHMQDPDPTLHGTH